MYRYLFRHILFTGIILGIIGSFSWEISWMPIAVVVLIITIFEIGPRKLSLLVLGIFLGGLPRCAIAIFGMHIMSGGVDGNCLIVNFLTTLLLPVLAVGVIFAGTIISWINKKIVSRRNEFGEEFMD